MTRRRAFLGICMCFAALAAPSSGHAASGRIAFSVSPHTVKPAGKVTLRASHLSPSTMYFFMFQAAKQAKVKGLVAAARPTSKGTIDRTVSLPLLAYCGPAVIQLFDTRNILAQAKLSMSGCKAGSRSAPPAPPHR